MRPSTLSSLADHIDAIAKEVTFINHYASIRSQFYIIVEQSPVAEQRNEFWNFVHLTFAHELIARLNRLFDHQFVDEDKKIYSLYAILLDVRRSASLLTRDHYVGISPCTEKQWIKEHPQDRFSNGITPDVSNFHRLNKEFDGLTEHGSVVLTKKQVDLDIKTLRKAMKLLNAYRNKILSHNAVDKSGFETPKFENITNAVKVMNELTRKYFLLITRETHTLSFSQPDITDLFMKPWIANEDDRKNVLTTT